jgi:hypothetical protein
MANSALVTALGVLTTISQVALTLSPAPELHRVHKTKILGDMIISPLVAMWINNHLWCVRMVSLCFGYVNVGLD